MKTGTSFQAPLNLTGSISVYVERVAVIVGEREPNRTPGMSLDRASVPKVG